MRNGVAVALTLSISVIAFWIETPAAQRREIDLLVERALVRPTIETEAGFAATLLVPPGNLYDPLMLNPRDGVVWIADDGSQEAGKGGSQEGGKGGRIWSVDYEGRLSTLVETARLFPALAADMAPPGFGKFAGKMLVFAQPGVTYLATVKNHVIQYGDLNSREEFQTMCVLPPAGTGTTHPDAKPGTAARGLGARMGPDGSPFANRFFVNTGSNTTIYQVTGDGVCKPFVTFTDWSAGGIAFTIDGSRMLVAVRRRNAGAAATADGTVLSISADGVIDAKPFAVLPGGSVAGMAFAPPTFGPYAGQLFVTGRSSAEVPAGSSSATGKVHRFTPDGKAHLVASGFVSPYDLAFVNDSIWVADINRDYIGGGFYLPDGFVVTIRRR